MNKFDATVTTGGFDLDGVNGVTYRVPPSTYQVGVLTNGDEESAKGYILQHFGRNYRVARIDAGTATDADRVAFAMKNRPVVVIDNGSFGAPTMAIGGDNLAKSRF